MVAVATAASQRYHAHQTAVALTPSATPNLNWVSPTPEPIATMGVGLISDIACCHRVHFAAPSFSSCWHTNVNGAWILVGSGQEGTTEYDVQHGAAGPVDVHGLIWVCPEPCVAPYPNQLYPAPRPDLHITAVDGPRITLASRDPAVHDLFVFDISTLQWLTPAPSPVPSLAPTP
jgi:hypothetical protein